MTTSIDTSLQSATIGGMDKVMSLRLPEALAKMIEAEAVRQDRSQHQVVLRALKSVFGEIAVMLPGPIVGVPEEAIGDSQEAVTSTGQDGIPAAKKHKRGGVQHRIDQLVRQREEARESVLDAVKVIADNGFRTSPDGKPCKHMLYRCDRGCWK